MLSDEPSREQFLRQEDEFDFADWRKRGTQGASSEWFATFVAPAEQGWVGVTDVALVETRITEIGGMWVYPEHRRRGIGSALLEAAVQWSADREARQVGLWVVTSNDPAAGLFRSAGFSVEGEPIPASAQVLVHRMARHLP
jgi:ribosomal protein S18 acetylase RimI-like enzyme